MAWSRPLLSSRASTSRRSLRDRHARAPRRVRRRTARAARPRPGRRGDAGRDHRHGIDSCRGRSRSRRPSGVVAALGIDPHQAATAEAQRVDELRELLGRDHVVAVGESGLDGHHGADTLLEQRALFDAHLALAEELPLPSCHIARRARTRRRRSRRSRTVVLHCFSEPDLLEPALERGYYVSFAGNVTYPKARRSARRRRASRGPDPRRDRQPVSRAAAGARARNEPARDAHARALAPAGRDRQELEARIDENASALFGLDPAMSRVVPKKALGQHFLVDRNVLGVIGRLAGSTPTTSCSRSAPGSGSSRRSSPTASDTSTRSRSTGSSSRARRCPLGPRERPAGVRGRALSRPGRCPGRRSSSRTPLHVATPLVAETLAASRPFARGA